MLMQTFKLAIVGTVLVPFTTTTVALCTTMYNDITHFSKENPFEATEAFLKKFSNFTKAAVSSFKDALESTGALVKNTADETGLRLKSMVDEVGRDVDVLTNAYGHKAKAVTFDVFGEIAAGTKEFFTSGKNGVSNEVSFNEAPTLDKASVPMTNQNAESKKTSERPAEVHSNDGASQTTEKTVEQASTSKQALSPATAALNLNNIINSKPEYKQAVDNFNDTKLSLSNAEQEHILAISNKISLATGFDLEKLIPALVKLNVCNATDKL